jgi:type I restriction enzyme R subunit
MRGLIISMIHKFDGIDKDTSTRDNVYVFIDEAHRSVAHDLGTLPDGSRAERDDRRLHRNADGQDRARARARSRSSAPTTSAATSTSTRSRIDRRRDDAADPHTMAPSEMTIPAEQLDKEFFELAEAEGVTDIDELNRVLERAVGLRTFLTADDRVEQSRGLHREALQGERPSRSAQGVRRRREPRSVRQVQARARYAASRRMVGGRVHRERPTT